MTAGWVGIIGFVVGSLIANAVLYWLATREDKKTKRGNKTSCTDPTKRV